MARRAPHSTTHDPEQPATLRSALTRSAGETRLLQPAPPQPPRLSCLIAATNSQLPRFNYHASTTTPQPPRLSHHAFATTLRALNNVEVPAGAGNFLGLLFNAFDKNGDGVLNYVEFCAGLSIILKGAPPPG